MYRLTLYGLAGIVLLAIALSFLKLVQYSPWNIALAGIYFSLLCYIVNKISAAAVRTQANDESAFITALILTLIVGPLPFSSNIVFLSVVAIAATASKYLLAWRGKHLFNPAAFGIVASALIVQQGASWWISNPFLMPAVLFLGLLLAWKIGRGLLITSFLIAYVLLTLFFLAPDNFQNIKQLSLFIWQLVVYSPLLFFAFIMLPEPQTSPKRQQQKIAYGILVAVLAILFQKYLRVPYTLELSLLCGNLFAYIFSHTIRTQAQLKNMKEVAPHIFAFWFTPKKSFRFLPGQFLEWTLYHKKADSRGVRRYFTIASSPTESELLLVAKVPEQPSTFKDALVHLHSGNTAISTGPEGDFVLPKNKQQKLAFIAGGVGITPFRSMAKYLLDINEQRDIVLLYSANTEKEFAFTELFQQAAHLTWKTLYVTSRIDAEMIQKQIPDFKERIFFISGPQPMVQAIQKTLTHLGVARTSIKHDYFPGYDEI